MSGNQPDIVRKLRQHALPDPYDEREVLHAPLLTEAADEIETLRARVAELEELLQEAYADADDVLRPYLKRLEEQLAACEKERDEAKHATETWKKLFSACDKEADELRDIVVELTTKNEEISSKLVLQTEYIKGLEFRISEDAIYIKTMVDTSDQLAACEKERDIHYNRVASILYCGQFDKTTAGEFRAWEADYINAKDQLAASQAREQQLREALQTFIDEHEECTDADDWTASMCSLEALHEADNALAEPHDTSALDEITKPLHDRIEELEAVIKSHGIPVKTASGGVAHYCMAEEPPPCNPHPDAPHGFARDASHSAGRYVCECEGWTPDET